jgi:hypothetical protein
MKGFDKLKMSFHSKLVKIIIDLVITSRLVQCAYISLFIFLNKIVFSALLFFKFRSGVESVDLVPVFYCTII